MVIIFDMNLHKTSYISRGDVYLVNGDDLSHLMSIWRKSLRNALQEFGFNVMSLNGVAAFSHKINLSSPAVLLLDIQQQDWGGIKLQAQLNDQQQHVPVVFLGDEANTKEIVLAMRQGAADFLVKPFSFSEVCAVIEKAMALDVENTARQMGEDAIKVRLKTLTTREREICFLMVRGYGNIEIAAFNGSAAGTVKIHRNRVLSKMGVNSLADLVSLISAFDPLRWEAVT